MGTGLSFDGDERDVPAGENISGEENLVKSHFLLSGRARLRTSCLFSKFCPHKIQLFPKSNFDSLSTIQHTFFPPTAMEQYGISASEAVKSRRRAAQQSTNSDASADQRPVANRPSVRKLGKRASRLSISNKRPEKKMKPIASSRNTSSERESEGAQDRASSAIPGEDDIIPSNEHDDDPAGAEEAQWAAIHRPGTATTGTHAGSGSKSNSAADNESNSDAESFDDDHLLDLKTNIGSLVTHQDLARLKKTLKKEFYEDGSKLQKVEEENAKLKEKVAKLEEKVAKLEEKVQTLSDTIHVLMKNPEIQDARRMAIQNRLESVTVSLVMLLDGDETSEQRIDGTAITHLRSLKKLAVKLFKNDPVYKEGGYDLWRDEILFMLQEAPFGRENAQDNWTTTQNGHVYRKWFNRCVKSLTGPAEVQLNFLVAKVDAEEGPRAESGSQDQDSDDDDGDDY